MTLTIDINPEQEAQLSAAAQHEGIAPAELVKKLLSQHLPHPEPIYPEPNNSHSIERDPELIFRVKSIRGKYAHIGVTVEELERERQADRAREEQKLQGENL